jgi:multidrug efflux pump subunit AcrA (membrane-fusion protein)
VTRYLSLPANLRADQQVALYARVSGFLKTIHVDVGDTVKAGQLLAELEVPELSADVARYQAEVEVATIETPTSHQDRFRPARKYCSLSRPERLADHKPRPSVTSNKLDTTPRSTAVRRMPPPLLKASPARLA